MNDHWYLQGLFTNTPNVVLAVTFMGLSPEQVIGQRCTDLMKCRNMNGTLLCGTSTCPITRVMQQKQSIAQEELIFGQVAGRSGEFSCSIIPVEYKQHTYVIFDARDIAGIKRSTMYEQILSPWFRTNFVPHLILCMALLICFYKAIWAY